MGSYTYLDGSTAAGPITISGTYTSDDNATTYIFGTVINGGGTIVADGPGATVDLYGTTVRGGTLSNNGGTFFGTPAGSWASLDGSTAAGPITIKGTYTSDFGATTYLRGTVINQGAINSPGTSSKGVRLRPDLARSAPPCAQVVVVGLLATGAGYAPSFLGRGGKRSN